MAVSNKKMHDKAKSGISPVAAALTGAVIGAGVAVAGAVALSDENNREKIKEAFNNVKDQATGRVEDVQKQVQDTKEEVAKKVVEEKEKVKKIVDSA